MAPNPDEFGPRLEEQRCRLLRRGVPVGVASGPGMCPLPSDPGGDSSRYGSIEVKGIRSTASDEFIRRLGVHEILLLLFFGLALFIIGYFAGRQGLAAHLSSVLKTISANNFAIASTTRIGRFRKFIFIALFVCFLTFIAVLLLASTTPHIGGLLSFTSPG
ncbi:unnamed protein product [Hydatigera taeniaeformis]|uniref:DUF1634 domain-containing protein n=1 Tax=Hydatigena taeniaeformis TaxID=6205 RepID=A0A0R3WY40_HYDTA|nr:unnamed protein product [Hydatigera taeniaeformis]